MYLLTLLRGGFRMTCKTVAIFKQQEVGDVIFRNEGKKKTVQLTGNLTSREVNPVILTISLSSTMSGNAGRGNCSQALLDVNILASRRRTKKKKFGTGSQSALRY